MAGYSFGNGLTVDPLADLQSGMEAGKKRGLASLLGQAYSAPAGQRQAVLGKIAGTDPGMAFDAEKAFASMDEGRFEQFTKKALMAAQAWQSGNQSMAQSIYASLLPDAQTLFPGFQPPPTMDDTTAKHFASLAGPGEQFTLSPGSARYDASGQVIAAQPFAPASQQYVDVPDGQGGSVKMLFDPKTGQFGQPQFGGAPAPTTGGGEQVLSDALGDASPAGVQDLIRSLAGQFGGQVTSLQRSPAHNAKVGGVANSQHIPGTAGDVVIADQARRRAYMDAARRAGLEVIDEGDHIHAELPPGARSVAQAPRMGYTPPKADTKAPSAIAERLEMARQMGATPEQLRRMVLGESAAPKVSATEQKNIAARKAKIPQLQNAIRGLGRIETAMQGLNGALVNTGPIDQALVKFTPKGQELEAAVGAIQNSFLALTRVPGIGAQSDLEARLAMLQYPSLDKAPEVNARTLDNLKLFARDLAKAYELAAEEDAQATEQPQQAPADDLDSLLDMYR